MSEPREARERSLPIHLAAASGLLMGGADAIPGVSGGTIALIIGIYQRFIESLATVVRTPLLISSAAGRARLKDAFGLLVPLGIGVLISYYLVTKILIGPKDAKGILLRDETAPMCYGFFFGLVLFSLREPWRRITDVGVPHFISAAIACAGAAVFVGLPFTSGTPETWMLLFGGAGAITVMLLPGISGSLLLVILGQYATVAGAVHDRDAVPLLVFAAGICAGVITFIPFLRYLLRSHNDLTMAALTGLMAGSLRALWPWKNHYNPNDPELGAMLNQGIGNYLPWIILCVVVGGAVVWLLSMLERRITAAGDSVETGEERAG
jgi:putative membrane protein